MATSITDIEQNIKKLISIYKNTKKMFNKFNWDNLDTIFDVALNDMSLFPDLNLGKMVTSEHYIYRWMKGYYDSMNNTPSGRIASPKGTCTDPAIRTIVKATQKMSDKEATIGEINHNLFMSAENIHGNLLEEYIAQSIAPYGFIWCNGNVLRAIDFCNSNGTFFLQIKNKNNTENSSSSKIRKDTSIQKWYRLGSKIVNKTLIPDYKWDILNEMINEHKTNRTSIPPCNMNENNYNKFLTSASQKNSKLITST